MISDETLKKNINFLIEIEKFKTIKRNCRTSNLEHEDDAQHTWHLSMFILTLEKEFPKEIDFTKLLKLSLVHDLPEMYAGDVVSYVGNSENKAEKEEKAMKEICELLPKEKGNEYLNLFYEYENQKTNESKIVKALDKLLPMLQSIALDNHKDSAYRQINVNQNQAQEYIEKHFTNIEYLYPYFKEIFQKAIEKKIFTELKNQ